MKVTIELTLAALQLLLLGLWIIGEQNRVDLKLVPEWRGLCERLVVLVPAAMDTEAGR